MPEPAAFLVESQTHCRPTMPGLAAVPAFILSVAALNLYLGYATAVYLGWGPPGRRRPNNQETTTEPGAEQSIELAFRSAMTGEDSTVRGHAALGDDSNRERSTSVAAVACSAARPSPSSHGADELAPELLAAIQTAINDELHESPNTSAVATP